jgi:hypothetical protein
VGAGKIPRSLLDNPSIRSAGRDADEHPATHQSGVMLCLLFVAYSMSVTDRYIFGLLVDPIKKSLDVSDTSISLLQGAAFLVIYSVAGIPFGVMADRGNRVRLISTAIAFWSVMTATCGLAIGLGTFVFRAAIGVVEAALKAPLGSAPWSLTHLRKNVDVEIQVAGSLRHRHAAIPDQFYRLELELAAELASLHSYPLVP